QRREPAGTSAGWARWCAGRTFAERYGGQVNPQDAFLEDIRDNPEDDAIRLIFADWLEERGDADSTARAEFIGLQCAQVGMIPDDCRAEMQRREWELRREHERAWLGVPQDAIGSCEFHRGFLDGICTRAEMFLTHAETLFRLHPLRHVSFGTSA